MGPVGPAGRPSPDCRDLYARLDSNGDGILTELEYHQGRVLVGGAFPALATATDAELSAHLKGIDANHDGKVTPEEFGRACDPRPTPRPSPSACEDCAQFKALDRDRNGTVSFDEYFLMKGGTKETKDRLATAFAVADLDGDGQLTAAELCGPETLPSASPKPSPTLTPSEGPSPSSKPSADPTPSPKPSASSTPSPKPSESPKVTNECADKLATYDTNQNGSVTDEEYFFGVGGTQATKDQVAADFKGLDTNGDGVLSVAEYCGPQWPQRATVNIYNPMTPFGPQSVDIGAGGVVTFANVNSGVTWTIRSVGTPSFPDVPLATSPATANTVPLTVPGTYEYKIDGTNPIAVHGFIVVH
jgi:Ca2+-binding EF-hand superfamily protein